MFAHPALDIGVRASFLTYAENVAFVRSSGGKSSHIPEQFAFPDYFAFRSHYLPMMILQVLSIFLCCGTLARALYEGDPCTMPNGRNGVCASLNNCPSVHQQLLDDMPVFMCTQSPVSVCCPRLARRALKHLWSSPKWVKRPTVNPTHSKSPPKRDERPAVIEGPRRGAIARQKCAEYSKYVFTTKYGAPPFQKQEIRHNECATRGGIKLIVKGTKAEPKEFPHMAAIGYNSEDGIGWKCGGSIISERFILTAAHCTWDREWGDAAWVRIGDLNLVREDDRAEPVNIRVAESINHPGYKAPAKYHDIALLRLETTIKFSGWARPACLHTEPTIGTPQAVATGWGNVGFFEESEYDLQKVTLPIVRMEKCKEHWAASSSTAKVPNGIINKWSICAGGDGRDTCEGDSGGPLVVPNRNEYCMHDIVGVTSIGQFCGFNVPGIYTRVYHYVPWIESKVWGSG